MNEEYALKMGEPTSSEIIFSPHPGEWVMKITRDKGILFNKDRYPDASPDDFAQAVIGILERAFTVKFERKNPPYDKGNH
jgi:hypothetical protein